MKRLVIDTNIWLDLLVFHDPKAEPLRAGLEEGRYRAVGTEAMRTELALVLARPQFRQDAAQQEAALARWDALVEKLNEAPACNLSCRDPDDRKFLDLAVAHRVDWLLSKDRALLAARKFAQRRFGLNIGRLEQMLAAEAQAAPDEPGERMPPRVS
ncbi:MAG: putative toxin-antitoxin system toxin component, PIN family [Lautropia sp.]|nr:putative toxin-antitoxin system toxin component, PIN family [Lautropia sp.]